MTPRQPLLPPQSPSLPAITVSKTSSHSNEADDERSSSLSRNMGPNQSPQYDGEDTRETSEKELRGFYAYGWASEVSCCFCPYINPVSPCTDALFSRSLWFVEWVFPHRLPRLSAANSNILKQGSFIPIALEQLARERGYLSTDHSIPCTTGLEPIPPPYNSTITTRKPHDGPPMYTSNIRDRDQHSQLRHVHLLHKRLRTVSPHYIHVWRCRSRVTTESLFCSSLQCSGALATMLFLAVTPKVLLLGALLAIVSNTCYGASSVLLNSFLPLLVRNHPDAQVAEDVRGQGEYGGDTGESSTPEEDLSRHSFDANTSLLNPKPPRDVITAYNSLTQLSMATKISSYGMGIGYVASLIVQLLAIWIITATDSTLFSLRLALFLIGGWWMVFTIPSALWLRPRPGPPLHLSHRMSKARTVLAYATYSWKSLGRSIIRARKLKDVLLFLGAWFLLSDAVATVSGTAVLFAKTSLEMKPRALALINVIVTISGVAGAFTWRRTAAMMGLKPMHTVLACIVMFEAIPLYGLLGYLPIVKRWGVGGTAARLGDVSLH